VFASGDRRRHDITRSPKLHETTGPETLVHVTSRQFVDRFSASIDVTTERCHVLLRQVRFTLLFKPTIISGPDDQNRRMDE
jgi:hypothetical protein